MSFIPYRDILSWKGSDTVRIDMDCVRDVLLCIEEHTGIRKYCRFIDVELAKSISATTDKPIEEIQNYQKTLSKKYDNNTLIYHVRYCSDANLIAMVSEPTYEYIIRDLTPKGHDFIENIREPKNWKAIKGVATKVGSRSLEAFVQIASKVISDVVRSAIGLSSAQ